MTTFTRYPLLNPVAQSINRLPNPSFEDSTTDHWTALSNSINLTTVSRTADPLYGSRRFQWEANATAAATVRTDYSGYDVPAALTQAWSASAQLRSPSASQQGRVGIRFYSAANSAIGSIVYSSAVTVSTTPVTVKVENVIAPSSAAHAVMLIDFPNATAGNVLQADGAILVRAATVPDYFDGNTTPDGLFQYDWNGTPLESSSTKNGPGAGDSTTPYAVLSGFYAEQETRTVTRTLMESFEARTAWFPPEAPSGVMRLLYTTAAAAEAARVFFATSAVVYVNDPAVPDVARKIAISGGAIRAQQEADTTAWIVDVPWVELP